MEWFQAKHRLLPWRGTGDPYAVWISEVMLQQTQIATVVAYYQRFVEAFPSVVHLAEAPLERVLELWSGLGYYRRARHLHMAAQTVASQYAGKFPQDYNSLRGLAGIGDYTAKAVLSIAFHQPYAVRDGNVARVVARLFGLKGNLHQSEFRDAVETQLELLLSREHPGDFNEAMMELGQTVCLPRAPQCTACPVLEWCRGFQSGNPEVYPDPRPRRAAEAHHLAVALLRDGSRVAMMRGLEEGLLDGLWNFPAAFGKSERAARQALVNKLAHLATDKAKLSSEASVPASSSGPRLGKPLVEFRHNITYRAIQGRLYPAEGHLRHTSLQWFELADLPHAAISQLTRKIIHTLTP